MGTLDLGTHTYLLPTHSTHDLILKMNYFNYLVHIGQTRYNLLYFTPYNLPLTFKGRIDIKLHSVMSG